MIEKTVLSIYNDSKKSGSKDSFSNLINALSINCANMWEKTSNRLNAEILFKYSNIDKRQNVIETEILLDSFTQYSRDLNLVHNQKNKREAFENKIFNYVKSTGFFSEKISIHYPKDFIYCTKEFIEKGFHYDRQLSMKDIFQAMRNLWTMNILQILFDNEVKLTPSMFAYSLLYPYTDNMLDTQFITNDEKHYICSRLHQRINGRNIMPLSRYEDTIFKLLSIIEQQYPRTDYYVLYRCLSSIHHYQTESLKQQEYGQLTESDILNISFKKGGVSVLTDSYLIKGNLNLEQITLSFNIGVLLQLIDDLQDVQIDYKHKHWTIFTSYMKTGTLDEATNKLINFIDVICSQIVHCNTKFAGSIKAAIKKYCFFIILFSISRNRSLYSLEYNNSIEQYFPFTSKYMKGFNKRLKTTLKHINKNDDLDIIDILNSLI